MTVQTTEKFQALVVALGSEQQAVTAWNRTYPDQRIGDEVDQPARVSDEVAALLAAGFSQDEALALLAPVQPEPAPLTNRERAEALVAEQGLTFTKGRIYATAAIVEAQGRVLESGEPEIVAIDGSRRTTGVLVFRMDDGASVAVQNLTTPKETA